MADRKKKDAGSTYGAGSIEIVEGMSHIRKRPGMYIGGTGTKGLHHLIWEILDNAVDEAANGYGDRIDVILGSDGSCTVKDRGRGIPAGPHPVKKISALRVVFEIPGAGGKFSGKSYKTSGGLHGVGATAVNALSSYLKAVSMRDGYTWTAEYRNQKCGEVVRGAATEKTGTEVTFIPDPEIFPDTEFSAETVSEKLRVLSYLVPGVTFAFTGTDGKTKEYRSEKGLPEFLQWAEGGRAEASKPFVLHAGPSEDGTVTDAALVYTESASGLLYSYVNCVRTGGGTHEDGFTAGLKDAVTEFIRKEGTKAQQKQEIVLSDITEGTAAVLAVKIVQPEFEGQTKDRLGNPETKETVRKETADAFLAYLLANRSNAKKITERIMLSAEERENAKKARELTRKKNEAKRSTEPIAKLAAATDPDPAKCEFWVCEGDSAGGNMKAVRIRRTQAVLPLRGKVFNCEGETAARILENKELNSIVRAFGAGVGNDFCAAECRYGKIMIATDADVDGLHIQCLLLVFFYRFMRQLIDEGRVYIALSPIFKVTAPSGKSEYVYFEKDLPAAVKRSGCRNPKLQRYKGLGELNADELYETTMNPDNRNLIRVTAEDCEAADRILTVTMGSSAELKRGFLED